MKTPTRHSAHRLAESDGGSSSKPPQPSRRASAKTAKAKAAPKRARREDGPPGLKLVAVGSATIDVIAVAAPGQLERAQLENAGAAYLLLEEGRKYPAQTISTHVGGGGSNVSVSGARLGWRSAILGVVGADRNGDAVLAHLTENRVEAGGLRRNAEAETGVSVMVASTRRNAAILVHRGANETLALSDVRDQVFEGAALVYIAPLSSGSADCFAALVEQGAWAGALVAANPGVRQLLSRTEAFLGALGNLDLLSLNARELSVLAPALIARGHLEVAGPEAAAGGGDRDGDRDGERSGGAPRLLDATLGEGGQVAPFRRLLETLHRLGPRYLSITDGENGAYLSVAAGDGEGDAPTLHHRPAAAVETVRGTAGAGDSYGSTLACLLAEGAAPETAMRLAAVNAASVVSHVNTTDGLLRRAELEARAEAAAEGAARF